MVIKKNGNVLLTFDITDEIKAYASFWWTASYLDTGDTSNISIDKIYFNHYGKSGNYLIDADMYVDDFLFGSFKNGTAVISTPKEKTEVITDTFPATPFNSHAIEHNGIDNKTVVLKIDCVMHDISESIDISSTYSMEINMSDYSQIAFVDPVQLYIDQTYSLVLNQYSPKYDYVIQYDFGELSGYINSRGYSSNIEEKLSGQTHTFRVPTSFYSQIPNYKNGIVTIIVYTYSGETLLGFSGVPLIVSVWPAICAPSFSATVVDTNESTLAVTGDSSKFIKFCSSAHVYVDATSKYDSTISSITVNGIVAQNGIVDIAKVNSNVIQVSVVDSRGVSTSEDIYIDMIPYVMLTTDLSAKRDDPTSGNVTLTIKGNFNSGKFVDGQDGSAENELVLTFSVIDEDGIATQPESLSCSVTDDTYVSMAKINGLDYEHTYIIEVVAKDKINTVIARATIKPGVPVFEWGKNDFTVNKRLNAKGTLEISSLNSFIVGETPFNTLLLDLVYPVGSMYMADAEVVPSDSIGGTWVLVMEDTDNTGAYVWRRTG